MKIKINEVLDHLPLSCQECMVGYFTVCSVRDLLLYREKCCLPHGHEQAISLVTLLGDVTGWSEMGVRDCSFGLRATWATVCFNKCGECLFLKAD